MLRLIAGMQGVNMPVEDDDDDEDVDECQASTMGTPV